MHSKAYGFGLLFYWPIKLQFDGTRGPGSQEARLHMVDKNTTEV